jgi:hypothetical protein
VRKEKLLKEYNNKIDELRKKGVVALNEFCGFDRDDDDDDDLANYQRGVVRDNYETTLKMPYQRLELYTSPTFGYKDCKILYLHYL